VPATPATTFLLKHGISFELLEYAHDPRAEAYGREAAEKLGLDPAAVFKTLVISGEKNAHALALVPSADRLSFGAAARALGWKRAAMADPAAAQRLTGYVLGGISPFGTKRPLSVILDSTAEVHAKIHVSGGRRGLEIALRPIDLVAALTARMAEIRVVGA
jgi:Cys-tRNA(Pro)/Cys-tRNA(Cys) deacylase